MSQHPSQWRSVQATSGLLSSLRRRVVGVLDRLAFGIFKQRAPDSEPVTWLPGQGTHGGEGGQTPPYVPYNPDWDPKSDQL